MAEHLRGVGQQDGGGVLGDGTRRLLQVVHAVVVRVVDAGQVDDVAAPLQRRRLVQQHADLQRLQLRHHLDEVVVAENAVTGEKTNQTVEMVVLATGMQPTAAGAKLPADLKYNADGFIINDFEKGGMFAAGCANKPADVVSSNQNATGMALKAIQTLVKR